MPARIKPKPGSISARVIEESFLKTTIFLVLMGSEKSFNGSRDSEITAKKCGIFNTFSRESINSEPSADKNRGSESTMEVIAIQDAKPLEKLIVDYKCRIISCSIDQIGAPYRLTMEVLDQESPVRTINFSAEWHSVEIGLSFGPGDIVNAYLFKGVGKQEFNLSTLIENGSKEYFFERNFGPKEKAYAIEVMKGNKIVGRYSDLSFMV